MPISRFETLAQELIEGSLGRLLGGGVTPADIAARISRVLEDSQMNETVADTYHVQLHPHDLANMQRTYPNLSRELQNFVRSLAQQMQLKLLASPHVVVAADEMMRRHDIRVQAMRQRLPDETTQIQLENEVGAELLASILNLNAYLIIDGRHHIPLDKPILTIGRRTDSNIVLDNPTISRHHAQLRWRYGRFVLYDLSQRHGRTSVNNQPVTECVLQAGDVITLSQVNLLYAEGQTTSRRDRRLPNAEASDTQLLPDANEAD